MYLSSSFVSLCIALGITYASAESTKPKPSVTVDSGPLVGVATRHPEGGAPVNQFLGIPYAQPPVGPLRFLPPKPLEPWKKPFHADTQPGGCMQYTGIPGPFSEMGKLLFSTPGPPSESEDCLFLNVYAPVGGAANKSVMFFIHGGSNTGGAISQPLYDGTSFAANQDIIVVTTNYRLNVFGFPRSPQLPETERNLGYLDQREALDWVQRNIHVFGGDKTKVTVMGESAGGMSVGNFINTYPENPPFRAGILQSGSATVIIPPPPANNNTSVWDRMVEKANCTDTSDEEVLACVRALPATTIQKIIDDNGISFSQPYFDNVTALEHPGVAVAAGNIAKVPTLAGSTAQDGSYFALILGGNTTAFVYSVFGVGTEISNIILQAYAPGSPAVDGLETDLEILTRLITDVAFDCAADFTANITTAAIDVPTWQYVFNGLVPSNTWEQYPDLGVYHASELWLQFGTYPRENSTEVEARLSQSMQKQFADFIKDPESGPGWSQWPSVGWLNINETDAVTTVESQAPICEMWGQLYALMLAA